MANLVLQNLQSLKKAQSLEIEIYQTRLRLEEIPANKAGLKQEFEGKKTHLNDLEKTLKGVQLKLKEKEIELSQKETQVQKLDGQLSQVKTNKEYSALQQEISSLKADNSLLEEAIIRMMDEVEAVKEEAKNEKVQLEGIAKSFQIREQELAAEEKNLQLRLQEILKQRQDVIAQLPPEIGELYARIASKKEGLALASVIGDVCSACQMQLRPQMVNDVRLGERIVTCENCSRILFFES